MTRLSKIIIVLIAVGAAGWFGLSAPSTAGNDAIRLSWSVETGSPINLPPVVVANRVLVIPKDGPLIAFDANSGKQKWQYAPAEGVWTRGMGSDGKRVFVCLKGGALAALEGTDGAVLWKIDLGINCQRAPLISGETLYVPTTFVGQGLPSDTFTGAKLFSINAADGRINWAFTSDNYILQTPFRVAGTVYLGGNYKNTEVRVDEGGHYRVYALDADGGRVKWTFVSEQGFPKALYATKDRLVSVGYRDFLVALDTANGKEVWRRDTGNWVPSLAGVGDTVYYGSANTNVHAWNMSDGKTRWKFNIPGKSFDYLMGKPVFAEGRMYFKSQRGTFYALDLENGKPLWTHPSEIISRAGLSISGSSLFIGDSKGRVYAYDILR
ncbi:MAG: PQQ-like beta-propeller repeat protein [Rhodospirillaceae bacterium]|mgnify:CR=1 FL=1|nr:PQQ-like beta-propeller repeat protein [Rhodospirillaceae bacterium]